VAKGDEFWKTVLVVGGALLGLGILKAIASARLVPCPVCGQPLPERMSRCPKCFTEIEWYAPPQETLGG
jgi:hypothetical protein